MQGADTRVNQIGLMGLYPPEKAASTGTLTRIVAKAMEKSKASKEFFSHMFISIGIYFNQVVFNAYSNRIIVAFLESNMKISFRSIVGIYVKFSLITLTICKSHFHGLCNI